jgi:hypothetical protein
MTWIKYQRAIEAEFPPGTQVRQAHGGGVEITVPCKHGHEITESFKMHMPPDKAKKVFANKGWRFWGKSTTCPEHTRKDDRMPANDSRTTLRAVANSTASEIALGFAVAPIASEEAKVAKRMAIMLLEDKFDAKGGRYKDGFSDLKVAKEVGLAEAAVSEIREEFFGPIREPAEIGELREKLAALQAQADGFEREWEASQKAAREKLNGMIESIAATGRKLAAMVARNGW